MTGLSDGMFNRAGGKQTTRAGSRSTSEPPCSLTEMNMKHLI